jgi:cyclin L
VKDLSAATVYMTAKVSASPRSLRSITNVYAYLLSPHSPLLRAENTSSNPESYYVSESTYITNRNRFLHIEGQLLNALGFNVHVALPHPLAITYLQALDVFSASHNRKVLNTGKEVGRRAIEYLNTALLSPQMLYLTHQPCTLATAAIYLAARDKGVKLPDVEWWEVFDCEREELGFLAVGMRSVEGLARREQERWGGQSGMITRSDVRRELEKMGHGLGNGQNSFVEAQDEEAEMARLMDEKVGAE